MVKILGYKEIKEIVGKRDMPMSIRLCYAGRAKTVLEIYFIDVFKDEINRLSFVFQYKKIIAVEWHQYKRVSQLPVSFSDYPDGKFKSVLYKNFRPEIERIIIELKKRRKDDDISKTMLTHI